jgi:hypothetical protein
MMLYPGGGTLGVYFPIVREPALDVTLLCAHLALRAAVALLTTWSASVTATDAQAAVAVLVSRTAEATLGEVKSPRATITVKECR